MEAAVCVILDEQNNVLCVSRKNNQKLFGLIGGKIESDETPKQAVMREVLEETGLELVDCKYLFKHDCAGYDTFCFIAPMYSWFGTPKNDEGCSLKWMRFEELIACSAFPAYNKITLEKLRKENVL